MGLSSPAAPGESPAAVPPERFDEAAAYAREQAEANAANSDTATTGTAATAAGPAVANTATTTPAAAATAPAASSTADKTSAPTPQVQPSPAAGQQHTGQQQTGVPSQPPNGGQWANPGNPTQPVQGVPVRGPAASPQPQHVIIGYMLVAPQEDCSCDLRLEGWLVVLILLLTVPCLAFIPCLIPDCFQPYQVPIYGPPGSYPVPIATPYYG